MMDDDHEPDAIIISVRDLTPDDADKRRVAKLTYSNDVARRAAKAAGLSAHRPPRDETPPS